MSSLGNKFNPGPMKRLFTWCLPVMKQVEVVDVKIRSALKKQRENQKKFGGHEEECAWESLSRRVAYFLSLLLRHPSPSVIFRTFWKRVWGRDGRETRYAANLDFLLVSLLPPYEIILPECLFLNHKAGWTIRSKQRCSTAPSHTRKKKKGSRLRENLNKWKYLPFWKKATQYLLNIISSLVERRVEKKAESTRQQQQTTTLIIRSLSPHIKQLICCVQIRKNLTWKSLSSKYLFYDQIPSRLLRPLRWKSDFLSLRCCLILNMSFTVTFDVFINVQ